MLASPQMSVHQKRPAHQMIFSQLDVDVGTVKFDLDMNMPGMVMHDGSTIQRTGTLGRYRAKVEPEMGGDWMAALHFEGPRGKGQVSFSVNVKL
jgi:hypothetical protein